VTTFFSLQHRTVNVLQGSVAAPLLYGSLVAPHHTPRWLAVVLYSLDSHKTTTFLLVTLPDTYRVKQILLTDSVVNRQVQSVQNAAARLLNTRRRDITPVLT